MTDHSAEGREVREMLGAYVLGQLSPEESSRVEAHLTQCTDCTADVQDVLPAADALSLLRGAPVWATPDPPFDLGDRVLESVTRARRDEDRRRWRARASTAAVAAVAASVVLVGGLRLTREDPEPRVPLEAVAVQGDTPGLTATADLVAHTWGVEVKLSAVGFDLGSRYRVTVIGVDGRHYDAGGFVGTGAREMSCNLNSAVLRAQAEGFEVTDPEGRLVAEARFG